MAKDADGWGLCVGEDAGTIFHDTTDPDYREILQALESGVVKRDEPGVWELLESGAHEAGIAPVELREAKTNRVSESL